MVSISITLFMFTLLFLIIGLYKPKWVLYGLKEPDRIWVVSISVILIMVCITLFGEGMKRRLENSQITQIEQPSTDVKPTDPVADKTQPSSQPKSQ